MTKKSQIAVELLLMAVVFGSQIGAQTAPGGQGSGDTQQRVAFIKQSVAENQKSLHQYQWTETTQLTLKGDPKPPKQYQCSYGPDGKVQKVPINASQPPQEESGRGGRLKQHVIEKKTAEMQDYMQQVKNLLAMYVPPSSDRIGDAFKAGNISTNSTMGSGVAQLVIKNYAQQGDQMKLSFDTATKKIQQLNVDTYLDDPKDTVTLAVQFASLPDGTNYAQQSVLDATAKKLQVTTTSSDYQKLGQ